MFQCYTSDTIMINTRIDCQSVNDPLPLMCDAIRFDVGPITLTCPLEILGIGNLELENRKRETTLF